MIDYVKNFAKYQKEITRYIQERKDYSFKHKGHELLKNRIDRLNMSWDMKIRADKRSQGQFTAEMTSSLVKEKMLVTRSILSGNFRSDPLFTLKAIGNTPMENAVNMQDLLSSNNDQTKFRSKVLLPVIDDIAKYGVSVVYTEYCENTEYAWRTIADPLLISKRVYGQVKNTKNAMNYRLDARNYFQNPDILDAESSDYRGHIERRKLSWLINKVKTSPDLYIKENVEKVIKIVKDQNFVKDKDYTDAQGRQSSSDYDKITLNDVTRGQIQLLLDGNEDDTTYYYYEMVDDIIIRFQDNPYDMNMNQYTVLTCEPSLRYFWGNTPAEYAMQAENSLNLLNNMSLENAIDSMKRYILFNKNAIDGVKFNQAAHNARIPVDVAMDVNLANIIYQYQPQETGLAAITDAYRKILETNQRTSSSPDLNTPRSMGGPANHTAYAASLMQATGNQLDVDILEKFSAKLAEIPEKEIIILAQYLGNFGPIMIKPGQEQAIRMVRKENITGNMSVVIETALQKNNQQEIMRYQNVITWLLNLAQSGKVTPNIEPLVKQVLKMNEFKNLDDVLPNTQQVQEGYTPTEVQPNQELAGAGQEVMAEVA